ncbi:Voltage-dependent T-type calcium channel subunit alpha-1H [Durusdinium trenchii]|uniref:Voltage-dependent T-type calcium channel subunit alpha-1H n=2 Tax=Durusdinium trenchii TaxID=1381693 RepID=A0ABP0MY16_9DINO
MVRRNCPAHALSTIFLVPRSSTLKSLATAITAAPHPDDHEMIVITQVFAMPGSDPSSAVPLGLNVPALNQWMECMMASHARKLSEDFYLVLALKKCASGSPLLLQHLEATVRNFNDWTRLSYEEFELTKYLQSLMDVINVNLRASCELDGRTLVPYMCAVPRKGWNENFAYIQGWLKMAGLAYKIHMGASCGPKIVEAATTRFVDPRPGPQPTPAASPQLDASDDSGSASGLLSGQSKMVFHL